MELKRCEAFTEEHEAFRASVRRFFDNELMPVARDFEKKGYVDPEYYRKAGTLGLISPYVDSQYEGAGGDFLHFLIVSEEMGVSPAGSIIGPALEYGLVPYYILNYGTEGQKNHWLPKICSGEVTVSLGMTEPHTGSDLRNIKTTAVREGDSFIVNGAKTYISNGTNSGLMILAAKTGTGESGSGITLFLVETDTPGYIRGKKLEKMGMHGADTLEIFFEDMKVPAENMLGQEGKGLPLMMTELPKERLLLATRSVCEAETALNLTLEYVREREAFNHKVIEFQNTQFQLADMVTEINVGRAFVDTLIAEYVETGELELHRTAMAKLWCTEMAGRVIDQCVQLHGGAGYMDEYWVSKLYTATRIRRIFGGTSEIMRQLIARSIV